MYSLDQVRLGLKYPELIVSAFNRQYTRWKTGKSYNPDGIDVFEEDWDNLIILDACRYDEFESHSTLPGTLESRISRASSTRQFIRANFTGKELHDTVYVSANGWYAKLNKEINTEVHAFEFVERDAVNGLSTRPETVTEAARQAMEQYPNKRLIIHYMQPHHPFLGETGQQLDHAGPLMGTVKQNGLDRETVRRAYRENLQLVLDSIEPLMNELPGLTVVTADHGELLGERERPIPIKRYSHPVNIYVEELIKVPWLRYQNGERKDVVSEPPAEHSDAFDMDEVEERLTNLGYRV